MKLYIERLRSGGGYGPGRLLACTQKMFLIKITSVQKHRQEDFSHFRKKKVWKKFGRFYLPKSCRKYVVSCRKLLTTPSKSVFENTQKPIFSAFRPTFDFRIFFNL